jgi:hypothetical protein
LTPKKKYNIAPIKGIKIISSIHAHMRMGLLPSLINKYKEVSVRAISTSVIRRTHVILKY